MGSSLLTVSVRTVTTQLETSKMAPPVAELKAMTDAFEGIDRLAEGAPRTDGAPNFRRLPGFPIFGTGQTSVDGFEKCLEPVLKKYGDEKHVFWVNLRQEPVVYVNGKPFTARDPAKVNFHLEMNNPEDVTKLENEFAEEIKKRGDDFKYFKDQFGEHPEERATNEELTEKLAGVTTLNEIYAAIKEKVHKFEPIRIPTNQEKAPVEANFDQIVTMLKDRNAMQMGEFEVIKELLAAYPAAKVAKAQVDK